MINNNLENPINDEEKDQIINLYIQQKGKNAFKDVSETNNVKVLSKD